MYKFYAYFVQNPYFLYLLYGICLATFALKLC